MRTRLFIVAAIIIFNAAFSIQNCSAQYSTVLAFAGTSNGDYPFFSSLISDGTFLYGMTYRGGTNNLGVIFKIKPDGTSYAKLIDFAGAANGSHPAGDLMSDGTFMYGMTRQGGTNDMGTVFKIKPDGTGYAKLLNFAGAANGSNPLGSFISDGTFLYGMTYEGGTNNMGVIFKIKPDGTCYTKLLDFAGASNGKHPLGSFISDGTFLYGMTQIGGVNDMGVIFKIKPDGSGYVKLLDFAGVSNGKWPIGSLFSDGTFLYGMTKTGGVNNMGVIFKIMPNGSGYVKLLDFEGVSNGKEPLNTLISDGTFLYGTTSFGGSPNGGVIFKIKPDGSEYAKLYQFGSISNDGGFPECTLILVGSFLYGTTSCDGANNMGTIFKYAIPVGIEENKMLKNFTIYPNPSTNGIFNIETKVLSEVKVFNNMGELLQTKTISGNNVLDLEGQTPGVYLIKIMNKEGISTQKIYVVK